MGEEENIEKEYERVRSKPMKRIVREIRNGYTEQDVLDTKLYLYYKSRSIEPVPSMKPVIRESRNLLNTVDVIRLDLQ